MTDIQSEEVSRVLSHVAEYGRALSKELEQQIQEVTVNDIKNTEATDMWHDDESKKYDSRLFEDILSRRRSRMRPVLTKLANTRPERNAEVSRWITPQRRKLDKLQIEAYSRPKPRPEKQLMMIVSKIREINNTRPSGQHTFQRSRLQRFQEARSYNPPRCFRKAT